MSSLASLALLFLPRQDGPAKPKLVSEGLAGYVSMAVPAPPDAYRYGVSLYSAAWPLVERPLRDFQIGLASIWIVPDNREINFSLLPKGTVARDNWPERGPSYRDVFQTIEGGLGFWGNTRYWTLAAKFRMNGTANGYNHEISSPGWGFGGSGPGGDAVALKAEEMGIAQLSSRILVPPDGLTFRKDTLDQLFGYAWMALPLTQVKQTPVATGNQCWTLFLNSRNFKGPVAFYTPTTWSRISRIHPPAIARGLDARPGLVTGGAIEINTVPRFVSQDGQYSRIPRLQFPADKDGRTVLIHNLTHYSKSALYDQVEKWLAGGDVPSGKFDAHGAVTPPCTANPFQVRQGEKNLPIHGFEDTVKTAVFDKSTFGLQWKPSALAPWAGKVRRGFFPDYCRLDAGQLTSVDPSQVPDSSGLKAAEFPPAADTTVYTSPSQGDNVWYKPGPAAGPFTVKLSDGSVVTYYWYRFIDQPALQACDLSPSEKARLQAVAEKIQASWTSRKEYMAGPTTGSLATLDPAMLVSPPRGMEVGYVPIATRQIPPSR